MRHSYRVYEVGVADGLGGPARALELVLGLVVGRQEGGQVVLLVGGRVGRSEVK